MLEHKRFSSTSLLLDVFSRRSPGPGKIAKRFIFDNWHMHSGQSAGTQRTHQLDGVAPISLDTLIGLAWDERWRAHHTVEALVDQPSVETVAAGTGFIYHVDVLCFGLESLARAVNFDLRRADLAEQLHVAHTV